MGEIMKDMSTNMQILHNAFLQIAKGNVHFKVFKSTIGDDTQSELKVLTTEEGRNRSNVIRNGHIWLFNHAKALLN
jgi:DNA repair protein RecN (Recombination protein N)